VVLRARGLSVELASGAAIIEDVSLELKAGEILGLVGESGSGKTTTALSIFGYHEQGVRAARGEIEISGQVLGDEQMFRRARGRLVSYVPQNPGMALNPSMRIADAIEDMIGAHRGKSVSGNSAHGMLERVGLSASQPFGRRFPHQLSGGQQQRVCIAVALSSGPAVVVLDEPTTGLDVITQARILNELVSLRDEEQVAMLYITHDLAVVSEIASRIAVMYAGRIVEQGAPEAILRSPRHPYTRGLMASTPDHVRPRMLQAMEGIAVGVGDHPPGCAFAPRCPQAVARCHTELPALEETASNHFVRCFEWLSTPPVEWIPPMVKHAASAVGEGASAVGEGASNVLEVNHLRAEYRSRHGSVLAASDVSFSLEQGGCVALVGESGSGKTTIARVIAGLHPISSGEIRLRGQALPRVAHRRTLEQRRRIQIVFQNPGEALNPSHTVSSTIARPARTLRGLSRREADDEVRRLLMAVRLPRRVAERYPAELSGGECQRVAIARALAAGPDVLVCDEITSALDVSVQAVVLELLRDLGQGFGVSLLLITHDLGVVSTLAERVLVLKDGAVCEEGTVAEVLETPRHEYTQRLLQAAPSLSATLDAWESATVTRRTAVGLIEPRDVT